MSLPLALYRGRYARAVARVEHAGVPIDTETLGRIETNRSEIMEQLIRATDVAGIYTGTTFSSAKWLAWTESLGIPWPRLRMAGRR